MRDVVWTEEALQDTSDILTAIAADSVQAAERVIDAIENAGQKLGAFATGRPGRVTGTYEKPLVPLPYILSYALRSVGGRESVVVLRIIHTSRDWQRDRWPH